ncbi:MAG: hypothetical protein K5777_08405 [Nitrosopumilus sp.]|nr:hypothetical protein [Nitrosopumilus sp.]
MKTWKILVIGSSVIVIASLLFFHTVNLLMFSDSFSEPSISRDKIFIGAVGSLFFIFIGVIYILFNYRWSKLSEK